MKVTLDTTVLAAGGSESPADLRIVQTREVQVVPRVRAAWASHFGRGNRRHEISFTVARISQDLAAASRLMLEFPGSIPNQGLLIIEESGPPTVRRYMPNAVVLRVELLRQVGVTTVWGFSISGGEIVSRDPRRNPSSGADTL